MALACVGALTNAALLVTLYPEVRDMIEVGASTGAYALDSTGARDVTYLNAAVCRSSSWVREHARRKEFVLSPASPELGGQCHWTCCSIPGCSFRARPSDHLSQEGAWASAIQDRSWSSTSK